MVDLIPDDDHGDDHDLIRQTQRVMQEYIVKHSLKDPAVIHQIFEKSRIYREVEMVQDPTIRTFLERTTRQLERYHHEMFSKPQRMKKYIQDRIRDVSNHSIQQNLVKMTAQLMDVYTMARMFKKDRSGHIKTHNVYIAGDAHIIQFTDMLLQNGATILYHQSNRDKDLPCIPVDVSPLWMHEFWM